MKKRFVREHIYAHFEELLSHRRVRHGIMTHPLFHLNLKISQYCNLLVFIS